MSEVHTTQPRPASAASNNGVVDNYDNLTGLQLLEEAKLVRYNGCEILNDRGQVLFSVEEFDDCCDQSVAIKDRDGSEVVQFVADRRWGNLGCLCKCPITSFTVVQNGVTLGSVKGGMKKKVLDSRENVIFKLKNKSECCGEQIYHIESPEAVVVGKMQSAAGVFEIEFPEGLNVEMKLALLAAARFLIVLRRELLRPNVLQLCIIGLICLKYL